MLIIIIHIILVFQKRGILMKENIKELIENIKPDDYSIRLLAEYLGYSVGVNPVTEDDEWKILFTDKIENYSKGVLALKKVEELDIDSSTIEVRRLYQDLNQLKEELSLSFEVEVVGFIGYQRIVFYRYLNGHRDERLDLNLENVDTRLHQHSLNLIKNENLSIEEDIFGFGDSTIRLNLAEIFKQELTSHFRQTTNFYRKKLSELITGTNLKNHLEPLLDKNAKKQLRRNDLIKLVQERSFTTILGTVVDTIILRQLMRRFLEGYYGANSFELSGIALGIGDGTLDDAIKRTVTATNKTFEEKDIQKLNQKKKIISQSVEQLDLFNFFDEEEQAVTSDVEKLSTEKKASFEELFEKSRKQFESVFDGDLFAGSVGEVANKIEENLSKNYPEFLAMLWIDTSSEKYSFRYEDLPPSAIEEHYEHSMSQNVQINIEDGKPVVLYGSTDAEQKTKGAYYTDHRFVDYMVDQTVEKELNHRIKELEDAVNMENRDIEEKLNNLLGFKVADLTCGGGSFLRGAFLLIASKHPRISSINFDDEIIEKYPFFEKSEQGQNLWEEYIIYNMVYGVDFDYKAILISSLTLSLSSLEHRREEEELPALIGRTLIHQNSLINAVPFYEREEIYKKYKDEIKKLRAAKLNNNPEYEELRQKLQTKIRQQDYAGMAEVAEFMYVEALEINLPEVFFDEEGNPMEEGGFDCIVGNPPWEVWKSSEDEFYGDYDLNYPRSDNKRVKTKYINELIDKNPFLVDKWEQYTNHMQYGSKYFRSDKNYQFQSWRVDGRRTGGDINLYIVSIERFNQLLKGKGHFSLLVPDNYATDAGSTGVRHLVFDNYTIKEFLSFENRKGIFPSVDGRYKFAVLTYNKINNKKEKTFDAFFYKLDLEDLNNSNIKLDYSIDLVKKFEAYTLMEVNTEEELDVLKKAQDKFDALSQTNLFDVGTDYHRTQDSDKFEDYTEDLIPLYEGKLMYQFKILDKITEGVDQKDIKDLLIDEYNEYRIAIRTIASSTNERTLIATLLPKESVATNSLHVQRNSGNISLESKLFYIGLLNSYMLDFFLRNLISTNVNKRYLMQLPVAKYGEIESTEEIVSIVKLLLMKNGEMYDDLSVVNHKSSHENMTFDELIAELNALVFKEYEVTRVELLMVMKTFESANHKKEVREETQRILDVYDRL